MQRKIFVVLTVCLGIALAGCSDDTEDPAKDQGVDTAADTGPTPDVSPDKGTDSTGPDLAVDASVTGCSDKVVGKTCTSGGSECGKNHVCLMVTSSKGYCSCSCTEDDPSTAMTQEDTCPGKTRCAKYMPPVASAPQPFCFKALGGSKVNSSSWNAADEKKPVVMAFKQAASEAFTAVAVWHKLLVLGKYCDNGLAHKVTLVTSSAAAPEASPTATETFSVAKATTTINPRAISNTLKTPLSLAKGGHAYLLVDMVTDDVAGKRLCLMSDIMGTPMERWVSDGPTAPYKWTKMSGTAGYQVSLLGF